METAQSGTGVFYQAMPAIGADGKRIMKLIPVQMVNGQYVQTHRSKPKAAGTSPSAAMEPLHLAPMPPTSSSAVQPCLSKVSSVKVPCTPVDSGLWGPTKQQQTQDASVLPKVPSKTLFVKTIGESVQQPSQLPVTVKSPALRKGHSLQVLPRNTQVWTVPASQLPQGIKTQFVTSQGIPSSPPGALSVVFVSPGTTMVPAPSPLGESSTGLVRQISMTGREIPGAKPHLKLIPKISHRPNSPTRWVVEEVGDSVVNGKPSHSNFYQRDHQVDAVFREASSESSKNNAIEESALPKRWVIEEEHINPGASQSVVSEILQVLSGKERVSIQQEAFKDVLSVPSQGQKNTLQMCNGKLFFVAKENDFPFHTRSPMNSSEPHQTVAVYSALEPVNAPAAKSRTERKNLGEVDEVIDLCDEEEPPQQTESVSLPDEDNVIFVSYSPPKTQSGSNSHNISLVQASAKVKGDLCGSNRGGEPEQTSSAQHHVMTSNCPKIMEMNEETETPGDHGSSIETETPVDHGGSRDMDTPGDHGSSREMETPGDHGSSREMETPGDHRSSIETETPVDHGGSREMDTPGDHGSSREMETPGDQESSRETESPGDQESSRETETPGDQESSRETETPGYQESSRETETPGDHRSSRETETPVDHGGSRDMDTPGDHGSSREMENSIDSSTSCTLMWTEESLLADTRLRQIHGVTADVLVVLERIDETAPSTNYQQQGPGCVLENLRRPQEAEVLPFSSSQMLIHLSPQPLRRRKSTFDRRSVEDFIEPQGEDRSDDTAVKPSIRRLGRTRKRTMCKCCSPEAKSSTGIAGPAQTEPPSKKEAGAKTRVRDDQPCRRHTSLATRSKKTLGDSQDLKHGVPIKTMRRFLHEKLVTTGVS